MIHSEREYPVVKTEDRFSATIAAAAVGMAKPVDGGHTEVMLSEGLRVALSHLLTVKDLAERYGVTEQLAERCVVPKKTIYEWNSKGTGPRYMRMGNHARYRLADVISWENARYADGGGEAA